MLVVGVGIDMIEVYRISKAIERKSFLEKVFSKAERQYCDSRGRQRVQSYAARFAGKEAFFKALGTGFRGGNWYDVEILPDTMGCPQIRLSGYYREIVREKGIEGIYVSLTHTREYAAANVVICKGEGLFNNEGCNSKRS